MKAMRSTEKSTITVVGNAASNKVNDIFDNVNDGLQFDTMKT